MWIPTPEEQEHMTADEIADLAEDLAIEAALEDARGI